MFFGCVVVCVVVLCVWLLCLCVVMWHGSGTARGLSIFLRQKDMRVFTANRSCSFSSPSNNLVDGSDKVLPAVHRGTNFELAATTLLQSLKVSTVTRVGKSGDGGIDIEGLWTICSPPVVILAQCKHSINPIPVKYLRDFDGAIRNYRLSTPTLLALSTSYPFSQRVFPQVAIFMSRTNFTSASLQYISDCNEPMIGLVLNENSHIIHAIINQSTKQLLPHLSIAKIASPIQPTKVALTWKNSLIA